MRGIKYLSTFPNIPHLVSTDLSLLRFIRTDRRTVLSCKEIEKLTKLSQTRKAHTFKYCIRAPFWNLSLLKFFYLWSTMGSLKNKCKQNFQQTYHHRKGPNMFLRMQDLLFLKGGIWDFNEKCGKIWDWKYACRECRMPKITIGIKGLQETLGRDDDVIEEPYWGPSIEVGGTRKGIFLPSFNWGRMAPLGLSSATNTLTPQFIMLTSHGLLPEDFSWTDDL